MYTWGGITTILSNCFNYLIDSHCFIAGLHLCWLESITNKHTFDYFEWHFRLQ